MGGRSRQGGMRAGREVAGSVIGAVAELMVAWVAGRQVAGWEGGAATDVGTAWVTGGLVGRGAARA
ncbi:hypothetical protein [Sulfurivirga sp.]|uniref:hypothetical protein n=1 Tax=Sulfurivirga sp. TaxID=2614236 RepID=UPI0025F8ECEF|nr:hypothetical protein [Sulfurivirga sp.]